ncbi:LITAF domain-containing protein-like [Saccoglossus kowalevskii]
MSEKTDLPHPADDVPPPSYPGQVEGPADVEDSKMVVTYTTIAAAPVVHVVSYREGPVRVQCGQCNEEVVSTVSYKQGILTWLLCFLMCLFGCWLCCWIPFCVHGCKDIVHTCPKCGAILGKHSRV